MPLQSLINSKRKNKVEFQVRLQNGRCRSLDLMQVADAGRQSHEYRTNPIRFQKCYGSILSLKFQSSLQ